MPPTPKEKHLFASNPFDDPPPSNNLGSPPFLQGSPRLMSPPMHMPGMSPGYMPKGIPPGWKPGVNPGMHGPPVGPGWQQGPENMQQIGPGHPVPCPAMEYGRLAMQNQHGPPKHPSYHTSLSMPEGTREGPPFGHPPMADPNHGIVPGHHPIPGYQRPVVRKQEKARKTDSWYNKTKKATKSNESSPAVKPSDTRMDDYLSMEPSNKLSSPSISKGSAPHAALPSHNEICSDCSNKIEEPLEDSICCLASCKGWYHRTCSGLTKIALECLRSEELALWACDRCLSTKEIVAVRPRIMSQSPDSLVSNVVPVKS